MDRIALMGSATDAGGQAIGLLYGCINEYTISLRPLFYSPSGAVFYLTDKLPAARDDRAFSGPDRVPGGSCYCSLEM